MSGQSRGWLSVIFAVIPVSLHLSVRIIGEDIDRAGLFFLVQIIFSILAIDFGMGARKTDAKYLGSIAIGLVVINILFMLPLLVYPILWLLITVTGGSL